MKEYSITLILYFLSFGLLAVNAELSRDQLSRIHREQLTAKYIKSTHLKGNALKKIKQLKKKIAILEAKSEFSSKGKAKLILMKKVLGKLVFWKKYREQSLKLCKLSSQEDLPAEPGNDPVDDVYNERFKLIDLYPKLTSEEFPKNFNRKLEAFIRLTLLQKK